MLNFMAGKDQKQLHQFKKKKKTTGNIHFPSGSTVRVQDDCLNHPSLTGSQFGCQGYKTFLTVKTQPSPCLHVCLSCRHATAWQQK